MTRQSKLTITVHNDYGAFFFFFSRKFLTWFLGIDEILELLLELLCKIDVERVKHKNKYNKDEIDLRRAWRIQNPHVCDSQFDK